MKRDIYSVRQSIAYGVLYAAFVVFFWLAIRFIMPWWIISFAIGIIASAAAFFLVTRDITKVFVIGMVILEMAIIMQYWSARVRNRAAIIMVITWYIFQLVNIDYIFRSSIKNRKFIIISLIFLLLYATVVFTLPREIEF